MPTGNDLDIIKPVNDVKQYRHCTLNNGLNVLLIHDPRIADAPAESSSDDGDAMSTEEEEEEPHHHVHHHDGHDHDDDDCTNGTRRAAAAMAVGVGSFCDPENLQGCSHFLEHMLFMGSAAFPDENDYDAFLTRNGGGSNAFTELEVTNYHLEVQHSGLHGALERFAQFFVAPLFKADAVDREVNAVENEFLGVLQSDATRIVQLRCATARPGHVFSKFSWGNRRSLLDEPRAAGLDPRGCVMDYFQGQYSAERMSLVVAGGQPLDELHEWVSTLFAGVPSGKGGRPMFDHCPRPFEGAKLYVLPAVRDVHELTITFQLPCLFAHYQCKADEYIEHLVGHEGQGSLLSLLKRRGWATELSAGVGEGGYDRSSVGFMFDVGVTLTEEGLHAAPGCGLAVVGLLFEYLALLSKAGPQRWLYDEMAAVQDMRFKFMEDGETIDLVTHVAGIMHQLPPEHWLVGPYLYAQWNPELIRSLLAEMTPSTVRVDLQTTAFDSVNAAALPNATGHPTPGREPWFGFDFVTFDLQPALLQQWASPSISPELALPPPNTFIATDFALVGGPRPKEEPWPCTPPCLLLDRPGLRVWYKLDTVFHVPKACAFFNVASPLGYRTPAEAAAQNLLVKLLEDGMCEAAYMADVAGLTYSVWPEQRNGIDIKVEGFSHKLPVLVRQLAHALRTLRPVAADFSRVKDDLVRKYRNIHFKPHKHASYLRLYALKPCTWPVEAVSSALQQLQLDDVLRFRDDMLRTLCLEVLVHGNVTAEAALAMAEEAWGELGGEALPAEARPVDSVHVVPRGNAHLYRCPAVNAAEENTCVEVYLQLEPDSPAARARADLLGQLVYEPAFNVLRTQEQLGYSLHTGMRLTHGITGFCIVLISGTHGPAHVDARIDAFLAAFAQELQDMTEDEFAEHKEALVRAKQQQDGQLYAESDRHWDHIVNRRYNFRSREQEVIAVGEVTKQEMMAWYDKHVAPSSKQRARLAVHVVPSTRAAELAARVARGVQRASSLDLMKRGWKVHTPELGPLPLVGKAL